MSKAKKSRKPPKPAPLPIGTCRTEVRPLADVNPAPYNPRTMTEEARRALSRSMTRWGCVEPIVVNERTGNVVGGHRRREVLLEQGVEAATVVLVDVDPEEEKALNVALNNPHAQGTFTAELEAVIEEVRAALPPEDFEDLRIEELRAEIETNGEPAYPEAEPSPNGKARTKIGQIWECGKHRVLVASPTDEAAVERLLGRPPAEVGFSDLEPLIPPEYGERCSLGVVQQTAGPVMGCHDSRRILLPDYHMVRTWKDAPDVYRGVTVAMAEDLAAMIRWTLGLDTESLSGLPPVVVTVPPAGKSRGGDNPALFIAALVAEMLGGVPCEPIFKPQSDKPFHGIHESVAVAEVPMELEVVPEPGNLVILVDDISTSGCTLARCRRALLAAGVPSLAFVWLFYHGDPPGIDTVDPLDMTVFDPRLGTGDTLLAAEAQGRRCLGVVEKPEYADAALDRWAKMSGGKPLCEDGAKWKVGG